MANKSIIMTALAAAFILLSSPIDAAPLTQPPNCTNFWWMHSGVHALSEYTARLYNYQIALESNHSVYGDHGIATNLFEGLQIIGTAGLYVQLFDEIKDDPSLENYEGFGNLNMAGFFSSMMSTLIKDTCEWLLSYPNDALTLRPDINCSHPAEQLMLSAWTLISPAIKEYEAGLGRDISKACGSGRVHHIHWVQEYLEDEYTPEINYLKALVGLAKKK
uniref:Phospholipase B-like n=1 Tax=Amphimedon queenslandica TaxID=400682 RepID=A0A1X7UQN7_AMPQE